MVLNHYAQIDAQGVVFALLSTSGTVDAADMIPLEESGDGLMGWAWDGAGFVEPDGPSEDAETLRKIDAETGMSRTMRETLLAIAAKVGAAVPFLAAKEAEATAARAKL